MILETLSKQRQTEKSNQTSKNAPQYESYSKIHQERHSSDLPCQTWQPKQVTLVEEQLNLEHELIRNNQSQKVTHNKTQGVKAKKLYIETLNQSITTEDIYELFRLQSTAYIHQTSRVDLEMSRKTDKNQGFLFIIILEHVGFSEKTYDNWGSKIAAKTKLRVQSTIKD